MIVQIVAETPNGDCVISDLSSASDSEPSFLAHSPVAPTLQEDP